MAQDLSSRRALIVDDEFLIAFDLEASMHELGFDVCNVASNEKDAKELAMSNPPDVAVIDVYLAELVPELKPRDGSRKCVTFPSFL